MCHRALQVGLNQTRLLAAHCEYRLRQGPGGWRISLKKTLLLNSDQPSLFLSH